LTKKKKSNNAISPEIFYFSGDILSRIASENQLPNQISSWAQIKGGGGP